MDGAPCPFAGVTVEALNETAIPAGGAMGLRMQSLSESGSQLSATVVAGPPLDQLSLRTRIV